MARIVISYAWSDGDQIQVAVTGKHTFPDALAQLRAEAVRGFRETAELMRITEDAE